VSPILMRPVREQLEHDRVIRQLQARWRRRYRVGVNPGSEQTVPVETAVGILYPDVVLTASERSRRPEAVVEVETAESVNSLEALAQWAPLARLKAPLHLYIPVGSIEAARRLCTEHAIKVAEIWSYQAIGAQIRFTLVHKAPAPEPVVTRRTSASGRSATGTRAAAANNQRIATSARKRATPTAKGSARSRAKKAAPRGRSTQKRK
jgi:hypothetical protein